MTGSLSDVRFALRSFRRNPGFAIAAIATLALGIGASTAIFSLFDAALLTTLPVPDPGRLVLLRWTAPSDGFPEAIDDLEGSGAPDPKTGRYTSDSFSFAVYDRLSRRPRAYSSVAAVDANDQDLNVRAGDRSVSATGQFVTGNFFSTVGIVPAAGRLIAPSDDDAGAPPVAVLSAAAWKKWFGGRPIGGGLPIVVNGRAVTAVGAAPLRFFGLDAGVEPDLWMPLHSEPAILRLGAYGEEAFSSRRMWWLRIVARRKPEALPAAAFAEAEAAFAASVVGPDGGLLAPPRRPRLSVVEARRGTDQLRNRYTKPLSLLLGVVGLFLLLACANVAGLAVVRSVSRRRELAVRASLGAGRARLVRQLLTESALLAGGAAAIAVPLAMLLAGTLVRLLSTRGRAFAVEPSLDGRLLVFSALIALLTTALFGIAPALRSSRANPTIDLRGGGPAPGRGRLGSRLAAWQIALSVVLLVVAGLALRTLDNLRSVSLGFQRDGLLILRIDPGLNGYEGKVLAAYCENLRRRLDEIPGVASATISQNALIGGGLSSTKVRRESASVETRINVDRNLVGADFFETLRIPLRAGRGIRETDDETSPAVAVVSARLARDLFGKADPIGRVIDFGRPSEPRRFEIVGLAGDSRYHDLRGEIPRIVYLPYRQAPAIPRSLTFQIRARGDARTLFSPVRRAVASLDPNVPIYRLETQSTAISRVLTLERVFSTLTSSFGALGLLLACVGLYGTLAYAVAGRTREIGIRMALGADRRRILAMVLGSGLRQAAVGAVFGLAAALVVGRWLGSQLFGLSPHDPATLVASVAALFLAAGLAAFIPARRASRVDPADAVRAE